MEKLTIGVVGLNFGAALLRREIVKGPGAAYFRLKTVCDVDREKADSVAAAVDAAACYDLEELLADRSISVVGLFTNPIGRAGLMRRIIRAGKDVITTKPFELDPAAAESVLAEAADRGRTIQLNSPPPAPAEDMACILSKIEEFELGRPVGCRGDIWSGYRDRPHQPSRWIADPGRCPVAPLLRLGIYLLNDLLLFFDRPQQVQVLTAETGIVRCGVPDNAQGTIRFADGSLASVYASFGIHDGRKGHRSLVLNFEGGTVRLVADSEAGSEVAFTFDRGRGSEHATCRFEPPPCGYRWDILYRTIRGEGGEATLADGKIVEGVKVLEAFIRAELTGRTESLQ